MEGVVMKKIIIACLLLIIPVLALAGCGSGEVNFWSETYDKTRSLLIVSENTAAEGIAIAQILSKNLEVSISGNSSFVAALTEDAAYQELGLYNNLLKASLQLTHEYLPQIDFTPTLVPQKQLKVVAKQFSAFEKEIDALRQSVKQFIVAKNVFQNKSERGDFVPNSASGLQHLREFKQAYTTLIGRTIVFNQAFEGLFIGNYVSKAHIIKADEPLTANHLKLANVLSRKLVAESLFQLVISKMDGRPVHELLANAPVLLNNTTLLVLDDSNYVNLLERPAVAEQYNRYKVVSEAYEAERTHLLELVKELDMITALNEMKTKQDLGQPYLKTQDQQKAQTIINFFDVSVALLIQSCFRDLA